MLYKLGGAIKTGLSKFRDFYSDHKKQIYFSLFMLSLHPHYKKFTFQNDENSNKIDNFLTYEDANERQNSLSNISYKVFFDFANEENKKAKNQFEITGKILISFDFDGEKSAESKRFLKIDYQGKVRSIYLDEKRLKDNEDFYINVQETKENFVTQEKNCVFIAKDFLKKENNKLLIDFSSEFSAEFRSKEINNPFLLMQQEENANQKLFQDFVFSSNDPYNLNKLFPCFDQPNFINNFEFFYAEEAKATNKKYTHKDQNSNKNEINFTANNFSFTEVALKTEKEEVLSDLLIEKQNLKLFKITQKFIASTNKITLIKKHLICQSKSFEVIDPQKSNEIEKFSVNIFFEEIFEPEIKALINEKVEDFLLLFKMVYEWFSQYFGFLPQRKLVAINVLKDLNKLIISNQGAIIMDVSSFNPNYDVIEKNYLNFLFVNQIISNIIHDYINISWWNDSFIAEGLILFITNLLLNQLDPALIETEETKYMKFIFNNLKNRAYKIDLSPDSHKIDMPIENTEEAFNFFDEVLVYKTAAVFDYFNNINAIKFQEFLNKQIKSEATFFSAANKTLFNRRTFYEDLYSIQFKNREKKDFLELKLIKIFEVLTENKGVIKIETKLEKTAYNHEKKASNEDQTQNESGTKQLYKLELTQHPLILEKNHKKCSSLYLMEIVELTLVHKSGKTRSFNIIVLPKLKNIYELTSELDDEIIGVFINTNDKNYLRQIFEENFIKNLKQKNTVSDNTNKINYLPTILNAFKSNEVAKLVIMRDLFFSLSNNELKELNVTAFLDICVLMLESEKNIFLKNEILKKFVFTIINFNQYYSVIEKEDFQFYKTIKFDSEIIYKRKAFDVLFKLSQNEPNLKKNIVNYLIDLLCHFYNVTVIDQNLMQRDDVKLFIELLQRETFPRKPYLEKFSPIDFYENVVYLDEITKKRALYTIMILYSSQSKYFLTAGTNLKREIGLFPPELDRVYKDSATIIEWKERKSFWKNVKKLNLEKMNQENFEKLYYLAKYIRNEQIKESKHVKADKFFKIFLEIIQNSNEFYSILFYKYLNPSYIITQKNLDDYKKMRNKIKNDISKYLLYLIDYDIYFLEKNISVYNHNKLDSAGDAKEIEIKS